MKNVMGVDPSISNTGIYYNDRDRMVVRSASGSGIKSDERLTAVRNVVANGIDDMDPVDLVVIEGYLNTSYSAGTTALLHGTLRSKFVDMGVPFIVIPPSSLKLFATGRGNASKTDMAVSAFKRAGMEFPDEDTCDAWWLWVAGHEFLGDRVVELPQTQRDALKRANKKACPTWQ